MTAPVEQRTLGLEYQTIFDSSTCTRRGLCPVTQIRNKGDPFESHSLYFEQHGNGPEKIAFIMGLNSTSFGWLPQVEHFARSPKYSALVFDNRGVGLSGAPRGPYTTSGMAEDVIALLDYLGWTVNQDLHVVGISLGGMIAQELAFRVPERIASLSLIVTTAGGRLWNNLPPWKGFKSLSRLFVTADPEAKIPTIMDMLFPPDWLRLKADNDPGERTNREVQSEIYRRRFKITRPQTPTGALSQMSAGITHYVSNDRLAQISKSIPKVLILTGDLDNLVSPQNSLHLRKRMPEAEFIWWEETGHGISAQWKTRFNTLLERVFEEGRTKATFSGRG
ncbi:Alpha/Beta hydrolase protein [Hygrophoropsis aurantiaca]|uniref:Alpha/Beta hydrolase protein n=1 Tax=Hygrophoropsis aurantiaca TaxID=72124 RepID=A0ACB8A9V4_9AGAM|nr:Alpha/Beta hydrolase protein [Hygrophoropsis aurantiaca]